MTNSKNLTAMTFNLRVNVLSDGSNAWPHRKHLAADSILGSGAHLIGTQEGTAGMLADLDAQLPAYSRIGNGRLGEAEAKLHQDEYCAIYYNREALTLIKHGQFWLSETPEERGSLGWDSSYPRICTWGCFESKERPSVRFYAFNTHFDHLGQKAREESAKLLLERIRACREEENAPVLLMGDLNAEPDNPAIGLLRGQLQDACTLLEEPVGRTFHDFEGGTDGEPIDYIFATQDIEMIGTTVDRKQLDGAYPSDHYPVALTWGVKG
ncbi:endonuclease/exonuclease/phosphatase family protein [Paenibacillus chitinolyticus]|uniref:endonuclease/exonuclease/phosphatase family protein n=1 Tax=Paenibacillus chitinolyticus TaxID=79263 RepID=UPI0036720487